MGGDGEGFVLTAFDSFSNDGCLFYVRAIDALRIVGHSRPQIPQLLLESRHSLEVQLRSLKLSREGIRWQLNLDRFNRSALSRGLPLTPPLERLACLLVQELDALGECDRPHRCQGQGIGHR